MTYSTVHCIHVAGFSIHGITSFLSGTDWNIAKCAETDQSITNFTRQCGACYITVLIMVQCSKSHRSAGTNTDCCWRLHWRSLYHHDTVCIPKVNTRFILLQKRLKWIWNPLKEPHNLNIHYTLRFYRNLYSPQAATTTFIVPFSPTVRRAVLKQVKDDTTSP
jgi:hypothetical protein